MNLTSENRPLHSFKSKIARATPQPTLTHDHGNPTTKKQKKEAELHNMAQLAAAMLCICISHVLRGVLLLDNARKDSGFGGIAGDRS